MSENHVAGSSEVSLRKYRRGELEVLFQRMKEAYDNGLVESGDLDLFMRDFKLRDSSGKYWSIGIQSGKWYYYDKTDRWVEGSPTDDRLELASDLKLTSIYEYGASKEGDPELMALLSKETNRCPACGEENNSSDSKFCLRCGRPLQGTASLEPSYETSPKPRVCPKCRTEVKPRYRFCVKCGTRIE